MWLRVSKAALRTFASSDSFRGAVGGTVASVRQGRRKMNRRSFESGNVSALQSDFVGSSGVSRICVCLLFASVTCVGLLFASVPFVRSAEAQPPKSKKANKVIGYIWEYHGKKVVDDKETGESIEGKFRVFNYEAFRGPKKVGYVKPNGELESTLTINDWPEMNGTVTLTRVGQRPPVWVGLLRKDDGTQWKLRVKFLQN